MHMCLKKSKANQKQQKYTKVHQMVSRSIKRDKSSHTDNLVRQAETAAAQGNIKEVFNITKKLAARHQLTDESIKDNQIQSQQRAAREMGGTFQ